MNPEWKKRITIVMALLVAIAAVRVAVIFYQRRQPLQNRRSQQAGPAYHITADDNVFRHKSYAYDLKSAAAELTGKTVWVSAGNQLTFYKYSAGTRLVDYRHEGGVLPPLEKLTIRDVVLQPAPPGESDRQLMAVFERPPGGTQYAVSIGAESEGNFRFIVNEAYFLEDPHGLYSHWPAEVWKAIDRHEVRLGMSELQASFALGNDGRAQPGSFGNRTLEYRNAGKVVAVTFKDNRAVEIVPDTK